MANSKDFRPLPTCMAKSVNYLSVFLAERQAEFVFYGDRERDKGELENSRILVVKVRRIYHIVGEKLLHSCQNSSISES